MAKKSKAYLDKVKNQKRIYRQVRNFTGNSQLAKKLSTWSDTTKIYEEYGLKITNRTPELKQVSPKKSKAYLDKVKNQKRIYRQVRNLTGNSQLAKKLSTWSNTTKIYEEYGLKITNRTPELKQVSPKKVSLVDSQIQKWKLAEELGYSVKQREAEKIKQRNIGYILDNAPKEDKTKVSRTGYKSVFEVADNSKEGRRSQWKRWSRKDNELPDSITDLAESINKLKGFDKLSAYGFAVAYYMYTENKSQEEVLDFLKPDRFNEGDIYLDTRKRN
jgi:hypothetical protein